MADTKYPTIRYQTLDRCFRNKYKRYYIDDLIDACAEAIYDHCGKEIGCSRCTILNDIDFMESNAGWRISLVRHKDGRKVYYRYEDTNFTINETLLSETASHDSATPEDELDFLSNIIKMLNDTYGLELSEEDKVEPNKMRQRVVDDEELMGFFNTDNSRDDVKKMFEEKIDEELLNFINSKLELYNKLTEDRANGIFKSIFFNELYDQRVRGLK